MNMLQFIILGICYGCVYSLAAIGLVIFRRVYGFVNFALGALIIISAYLCYACITICSLGLLLSSIIAIFATCIIAVIFEISIFRPLQQKNASSTNVMLASLGLFIVFSNIISLVFGDQAIVFSNIAAKTTMLVGLRVTHTQLIMLLVAITYTVLLSIIFKTKLGISLRAAAGSVELAKLSGVSIRKVGIFIAVLTALPASLAGILWACDNSLSIHLGYKLILLGLTASIVGGSRWMTSALFGGLFVGVVQYAIVWKLPTEWQDALVFILLTFFILFKPEGFFGKQTRSITT